MANNKNIFSLPWMLLSTIILLAGSCTANHKIKKDKENAGKQTVDQLPACVQSIIKRYESEELQNPPAKIYRYRYKDSLVYYITPPCCDFFSDLYSSNCVLLGHPDGGFTGKGDGKFADFTTEAKDKTLIWEDTREQKDDIQNEIHFKIKQPFIDHFYAE